MAVWTIVVAAGSGERFGGSKQLMPLGATRVIDLALAAARSVSDRVVVVVPPGVDWGLGAAIVVAGGATRSASVRAGLAAVPDDAEVVLVHDAARPLAAVDVFERVIDAVRSGADGAVPALPIADTVKQVRDGVVVATLPRDDLVTVQTPQAFRAAVLRAAHAAAPEGTDDAAVVEAAGGTVVVVTGAADNFKITTPADLQRAVALLATRGAAR
ncbi:MAG: 2-C-methyl-D-erythritol 4-phosphate cytidylyltransferase [Acidimicrobiia bacterium]